MKILIFEYITGGGFNKKELPESLAKEGRLMLNGLLRCLSLIRDIELMVMLDWRVCESINTAGMNAFVIKPEHDTSKEFERLAAHCDAIWPVAPEFDSLLKTLCDQVASLKKLLLTSPAMAVAMTGNKWFTFRQLTRYKIATVDTWLFDDWIYSSGKWIVKPVDGAGCNDSYLLTSQQGFAFLTRKLSGQGQFIIQPHLHGKKTSLSCLFKQGRAWLLCANLQRFKLINKQYHLQEIEVNYRSDINRYRSLVQDVAEAFPDLWGYAGIDLIETTKEILVLEINPRLTTSFVAIQAATGINTCQCVLELLEGEPSMNPLCNESVTIKI
jgi:predicted ATP-grasp superfamily ATP-dependent carboligase